MASKTKQKNFSFSSNKKTALGVAINISLSSGLSGQTAEQTEREARKKNIPLNICEEVTEKLRKGDYSVFSDPKYKEYI